MAKSLVIVESPAKAKTINKYLGRGYSVQASYGHVMDLPKKVLGIDTENGFEPTYEVIPGKVKVISELKKAAKAADAVYLAGDPDREGEAICAHLAEVLGKTKADRKKIFRVMFNEITPKAIKAAFDKPGQVDTNLVDAQQARRVLDRLVGYKISPLLWDKVRRGLSAGRVQTVALRLIVEREMEIRAFTPKEYWTIHALLAAGSPPAFEAKLHRYKDEEIEVNNEAAAQKVVADVEKAAWLVSGVVQKEKRRYAPPPFTTSKLQQAGYNRLRYTAKRTMMLAQRLYEGVELGDEGSVALITYMRTDSVRVSNDALDQVREHIGSAYGPTYLPEKPNVYKSKKDAQEGHEAVRPTDVTRTPDSVRKYLEDDMFKLYQLIWQRFVASQMVPAVFDQTTIDIAVADYQFRATGSVMKFEGFLAAYQAAVEDDDKDPDDAESRTLPQVSEGERLTLDKIRPDQHFTEPPPRYTEATLVKELEEKGIGRPSTYASIISVIVEREYVNKDQGRFTPTMLGEKVSGLLVKSFEDIFDVGFTARLEEELDEIEEGKLPWRDAVKEFWDRFTVDLDRADEEDALLQGGNCHWPEVREVRRGRAARTDQPPWILPGLFALSGLRFHSRPFRSHRAGGSERAAENRTLRQLRQGNADQARPLWRVSGLHRVSRLQDHQAPDERNENSSPAGRAVGGKLPHVQFAIAAPARAFGDFIGCRNIRSASTPVRSPWASSARSAVKANSYAAVPPKGAAGAGFSTAAAAIRTATTPARTSRSPKPARSAALHLSSRNAPSWAIFGMRPKKAAIGEIEAPSERRPLPLVRRPPPRSPAACRRFGGSAAGGDRQTVRQVCR